jgi:hypothetical protein
LLTWCELDQRSGFGFAHRPINSCSGRCRAEASDPRLEQGELADAFAGGH